MLSVATWVVLGLFLVNVVLFVVWLAVTEYRLKQKGR